ncbi:MAG: heme-binding protein, partial [Patescibacteria group bacterium]|nr:heme-binding protein [Patescibacteria group bacterium]
MVKHRLNNNKRRRGLLMKKKEAKRIVNFAIAIADALGISGAVAVVDTDNNFIDGTLHGYARPMTYAIATNKAALSGYTGARTGTTAKQIASGERTLELYGIAPEMNVPFPGGCPIYTKDGVLIGGAGFSEQTGITDERIISAAIEACGFLSDTPVMTDISQDVIIKAVK